MDEITMRKWASRIGLTFDRAKDLANLFGSEVEAVFRRIAQKKGIAVESETKSMDEQKIKSLADYYDLAVDKVRAIVRQFGNRSQDVLQSALEAAGTEAWNAKITRHVQRGGKVQDFATAHKARAQRPTPQPTRAQVIAALAKRFNVSEAALTAAVLQHGSIAGAIEAIKAQQTTVDSLIFPAQKRVNSMSPGVMWGQTRTPQPTPTQKRGATVESLMFGGKSRQRADSPIDWFFGDLNVPKKR